MSNIKPTEDRLFVKRREAETKTKGGIIIPDTVKDKPMEGEVICVGPGRMNDQGIRISMTVKKGDIVIFAKWSGTEIKVDGEELLVMKESDVLAIIENGGHDHTCKVC